MIDSNSSLLDVVYNADNENLEFVDVTVNISTLLMSRVVIACNKTNLGVDSFISVSILRALLDYEQYSNSI